MPRNHRRLGLLAAALLSLPLAACDRGGSETAGPAAEPVDPFAIPAAALTERAQRDSARVAQLVQAFFQFAHRGETDKAFACYFPDSIPVATPGGDAIWEGQSQFAWAEINDEVSRPSFAGIEILRRAEVELLERTQREIWLLQFRRGDVDSTRVRRRIHILHGLGDDTRFVGRIRPEGDREEE